MGVSFPFCNLVSHMFRILILCFSFSVRISNQSELCLFQARETLVWVTIHDAHDCVCVWTIEFVWEYGIPQLDGIVYDNFPIFSPFTFQFLINHGIHYGNHGIFAMVSIIIKFDCHHAPTLDKSLRQSQDARSVAGWGSFSEAASTFGTETLGGLQYCECKSKVGI